MLFTFQIGLIMCPYINATNVDQTLTKYLSNHLMKCVLIYDLFLLKAYTTKYIFIYKLYNSLYFIIITRYKKKLKN